MSLQITHEVFFPQNNSFLAIILQLPIPKTQLNSIPLLPTSYPGRMASRNSALLNWTLLYNYFACTTQKTKPLYWWEGVFTAPLHSNRSYPIVAFVFVAAGMCLPSLCLTMNVYSDFNIPALGRHVTIDILAKCASVCKSVRPSASPRFSLTARCVNICRDERSSWRTNPEKKC
jgi:hypothetical protein